MPKKPTPEQRSRIAALVRQARNKARLSIEAAAKLGDLSHMTWIKVEAGEPVRDTSYLGIVRALGWPLGALDEYLATGLVPGPVVASAPESGVTEQEAIDLVLASDYSDTRKVELIKSIRTVHALRQASQARLRHPEHSEHPATHSRPAAMKTA